MREPHRSESRPCRASPASIQAGSEPADVRIPEPRATELARHADRLAHLRVDNVTDCSTDIRAYLETHDGRPHRTYREAYYYSRVWFDR